VRLLAAACQDGWFVAVVEIERDSKACSLRPNEFCRRNQMKINWFKWCLFVGGSSVAALQLGSCVRNVFSLVFDGIVLAAVN
jgi:hypothetical protein